MVLAEDLDMWLQDEGMPTLNIPTGVGIFSGMIRFLSSSEFAARIGIAPATLKSYSHLPEIDALTGTVRGWLPETVDAWHAGRPGHGGRLKAVAVPSWNPAPPVPFTSGLATASAGYAAALRRAVADRDADTTLTLLRAVFADADNETDAVRPPRHERPTADTDFTSNRSNQMSDDPIDTASAVPTPPHRAGLEAAGWRPDRSALTKSLRSAEDLQGLPDGTLITWVEPGHGGQRQAVVIDIEDHDEAYFRHTCGEMYGSTSAMIDFPALAYIWPD